MLTIRKEQVDAFRQHHLRKFADEMVAHLQGFAPQHWRSIGEQTGREVIRLGMEQARRYGFTNRGPVRFYVELMFLFGSYFDTDPQFPWANAVLTAPEPFEQMARAQLLFDALNEYSTQVRGPKHKYFIQALQRLSETPIEGIVKPDIPLEETAIQGLEAIYPETYDYLGEPRVRAIIRESFDTARRYGFNSVKGMLLMVGLTFFMGHGFPNDPLCGWIARRLDEARFPDTTQRTEGLYAKATLYMKHVLAGNGRS